MQDEMKMTLNIFKDSAPSEIHPRLVLIFKRALCAHVYSTKPFGKSVSFDIVAGRHK